MVSETMTRNETLMPVYFLLGIYAGLDISHPIPGEFSYHSKSCSPKISEKPRECAETGLTKSFDVTTGH